MCPPRISVERGQENQDHLADGNDPLAGGLDMNKGLLLHHFHLSFPGSRG